MPKYTQNVNGGPTAMRSDGYFTVTGTTEAMTALSDTSDSTYCKVATGATLPVDMVVAFPSLGAGERVVSVCPWVRSKQPGTKTCRAAVAYSGRTPPAYNIPYAFEGVSLSLPTVVGSATDYTMDPRNGQLLRPGGLGEWKWYQNTFPMIAFYDPHTASANFATWYKAGLDFYALKAATVAAPTAPTGTVSTTQYPTCTATVSAVVESWQPASGSLAEFYTGITIEWSVYSGSLTFPSGTPLAKWEQRITISNYIDGTTASTLAASTTPPVALPNGSLTLFARVSRDHPSGTPAWSFYAYKQWTQSAPNPTTPTLTLTNSDANQRVQVQVNAPTTDGYDSSTGEVQVQRQMADGTWRNVRGMYDVAITIGSTVTVGYDLEASRGATNTYRARSSMWHTVDAVRRYSAWDTETVTGPATGTWNLKAVDLPAANLLSAPVAEKPSESSQAPATVLEPLDRDRPVVLLGTLGGFSGSLDVACNGSTQIAAVKALEAYRGTVYLEDAFGESRWVAITKVSWNREGTSSSPRRVATIEYVEVDSGLGSSDA